jgi:GNAT superfamily N-acetyltransferase
MHDDIRSATPADLPALRTLIDASVRELSRGFYTAAQVESALRYVFGPDTRLIADGTYYVLPAPEGLAAAGGWSRRLTLFGGDQMKGKEDPLLDPATEPARIRAFYVHPAHARKGLGRLMLEHCSAAAREAGFLRLELMSTMPGVPLYTAMGFASLEPTVLTLPDGVDLPMVRMGKPL